MALEGSRLAVPMDSKVAAKYKTKFIFNLFMLNSFLLRMLEIITISKVILLYSNKPSFCNEIPEVEDTVVRM